MRSYEQGTPLSGVMSGWSPKGGQCISAYLHGGMEAGGNPLGSSSGSAVGLSAGFGAAALGSDTSGSVVSADEIAVRINSTIDWTCAKSCLVWYQTHQGACEQQWSYACRVGCAYCLH